MKCLLCKTKIIFKHPHGYKRKYCSDKCRYKYYYLTSEYDYIARAKIKLKKICPICGKHFEAKNIRRICCYGVPFKNTCYRKLKLLREEGLI